MWFLSESTFCKLTFWLGRGPDYVEHDVILPWGYVVYLSGGMGGTNLHLNREGITWRSVGNATRKLTLYKL